MNLSDIGISHTKPRPGPEQRRDGSDVLLAPLSVGGILVESSFAGFHPLIPSVLEQRQSL